MDKLRNGLEDLITESEQLCNIHLNICGEATKDSCFPTSLIPSQELLGEAAQCQ
jgi:hypothetical protein